MYGLYGETGPTSVRDEAVELGGSSSEWLRTFLQSIRGAWKSRFSVRVNLLLYAPSGA